jgi:hypothetical protein
MKSPDALVVSAAMPCFRACEMALLAPGFFLRNTFVEDVLTRRQPSIRL